MDLQTAFDEGFDALKGYVDRSFAAFELRIEALERQVGAAVSTVPVPGTDPDKIRALVISEVERAVAAIPKPQDGKSVDPAAVAQMVADEFSRVPPAAPGKDVDPVEVAALVKSEAERILSTWVRPQDGKSVTIDELKPLLDGLVKQAVALIPAPKDGAGVVGDILDWNGHLKLIYSDGRVSDAGRVVGQNGKDGAPGEPGKDGAPGRDGADGNDGLGFENLDVIHDGERRFTLRFVSGDHVKAFDFNVPVMLYRGVYREGDEYVRGDTVTFGGSLWHCDGAPEGKPGDAKGWTLCAKRGRDGKDAKA